MSDQRREHFRLRYPAPVRPKVLIGDHTFAVIELSEGGLRFRGARADYPSVGEAVEAAVVFSDGERVRVCGQVLRMTEEDNCVLQLSEGVPLARMMDEQRRMISKHRV